MIHCLSNARAGTQHTVLRNMFEARKRIFIDLLRWDLPVLAGRFEVDRFDNDKATYIVLADTDGAHRASARLLPTTEPHILDTLFAQLCEEALPRDPTTMEITRFCLERKSNAVERRAARDELIHALVAFGLANGIKRYTGVAEVPWLRQILSFGWRCRQLGRPALVGGRWLGAMTIEIDEDTPALLERGGVPVVPCRRGSRHVH
ncbi:N-acyl-L-homoserine lactone synthase [Novosphingobium sp. Rr 2-17]|uniref:acyl-homoserine-lactone synthase n=1 Tax=Novosphingobium sp. Rr 2-17 TaxID=555793 RepID=UPI0002698BF0|nr:acyl-homoserine-lactone synthase [Novosphingobium sp. Rr 2-17]EIZ78126.1 N-acyl-L-homoserine lactone synthase [Novosphingobium sp. Rr 2-17]